MDRAETTSFQYGDWRLKRRRGRDGKSLDIALSNVGRCRRRCRPHGHPSVPRDLAILLIQRVTVSRVSLGRGQPHSRHQSVHDKGMDFVDDEAEVSSQDEAHPSQSPFDDSQRPAKRRRLDVGLESTPTSSYSQATETDDYRLPENRDISEEESVSRLKKRRLIHIPEDPQQYEDTYVTQLSQPYSSPSRIRGARWAKKPPPPIPQPEPAINRENQPHRQTAVVEDEFGGDDPALLEAFFSSPVIDDPAPPAPTASVSSSLGTGPASSRSQPKSRSFRQTTLFGGTVDRDQPPSSQARARPLANKNEAPTHHKLSQDALDTWVYPTNLGAIRDYQFNMVQRGLFHNTLVALPTGLGKTFIAATIMLNWFRWTNNAQIVFVAPTKPLVSQQVNACFNTVGIPRSATSMLTGNIQPAVRADEWQTKRVFFMTPQTLINDLKTGLCDPKRIVLLVVDEAHRATGGYAYVEVVKFLLRFNPSFRVLALTATPGATVEAVQHVIDGLNIARVEIRTEESLDIRQYAHMRNTELEIFGNSDEISMALELFASAVRPVLNQLTAQNAYWGKDPLTITLFGLKTARDDWMRSPAGRNANWGLKGKLNALFTVLMRLALPLELLKFHGIGPFYHKLKAFEEEESGKYAKEIMSNENFKRLMNRLRMWINNPDFVGHPKLSYLQTLVMNHFIDAAEGHGAAGGQPPSDTRIMIFSHYRDSAEEIARVLNRNGGIVRAHVFVGQQASKGSDGMDQKTQLEIIEKFKKGTYNTIVATSIGEEGLDIGEIDLIVCYDCSKSPIRMLQRMGRTGRKRAGNIVLLLMRGKEENDYYKAKDNYEKIQAIIASGTQFTYHDDTSPRIVPKGILPVVDKRAVEIPLENTQHDLPIPRKRAGRQTKRPPKKFHMPDGVETGFTFLGRSKGGTKAQLPKQPAESLLDQSVADLPELSEVILSPKDQAQLEDKYAQVAGTEAEYIRKPRLDAFPNAQRREGSVGKVRHSRATSVLVRAFRVMRDPDRDWKRPTRLLETFEHGAGASRDPESTETVMNGISDILFDSSPPAPFSQPFYVSQKSTCSDGTEFDLPEFHSLISTRRQQSRPVRRVLDDDDD